MRFMGGLQWCTGLVPCTRESKLLGTNPCALETPTLAESTEKKTITTMYQIEAVNDWNKQTINREKKINQTGW